MTCSSTVPSADRLGGISVLLGNGAGGFASHVDHPGPAGGSHFVVLADLNNDGTLAPRTEFDDAVAAARNPATEGRASVRFSLPSAALAPGVYFVRLVQGTRRAGVRVAVVR